LVIISYTTGLSFALKRIGPLAAIIITVFYLLALYLLALSNTHENQFASIYSEFLIKTTCQDLLLLVGFDTLIYRKYYDTPPILVGHHEAPDKAALAETERGVKHVTQEGKGDFGSSAGHELGSWLLLVARVGGSGRWILGLVGLGWPS
jgi:hypothetical protein